MIVRQSSFGEVANGNGACSVRQTAQHYGEISRHHVPERSDRANARPGERELLRGDHANAPKLGKHLVNFPGFRSHARSMLNAELRCGRAVHQPRYSS